MEEFPLPGYAASFALDLDDWRFHCDINALFPFDFCSRYLQEETQDLLFTPRILAYPLKEGRQRVWPLKGQAGQQQQQQPQGQQHFDTRDWHQEKMARLKDLRVPHAPRTQRLTSSPHRKKKLNTAVHVPYGLTLSHSSESLSESLSSAAAAAG